MTRLINAMIVGAEKAGTTSLLRYLSEHPEILSHKNMEMPYFVDDKVYKKGWEKAYKHYFPSTSTRRVLLAKSVGCMYWEDIPARLHVHNPNMQLIAVLRNPVARAYSAYRFALNKGRETAPTFEEAIASEEVRLKTGEDFHLRYHAYLKRGLYAKQLEGVFRFFPHEQVHIILFDELQEKPEEIVSRVFQFLGLDPVAVNTAKRYNETAGKRNLIMAWLAKRGVIPSMVVTHLVPRVMRNLLKERRSIPSKNRRPIPPINTQTKIELLSYYEPEIGRIEELLGRALLEWRQ